MKNIRYVYEIKDQTKDHLIHYNKQRIHIQYDNKTRNIFYIFYTFIERIENFITFVIELSNMLD